ncbi:MAG: hypothetical protein IKS56_09650 [Lachnospiraceae bacterium]|nr:hypothetical protein [Lachnospiraceae bacterium]
MGTIDFCILGGNDLKRIFGFIGIIAASLFVFSCTKPEQTVEIPKVIEESVVSEPAPEPVVEESEVVETPEIIEELKEEESAEEYDYSAEHIMNLVEDTAFYAPSFKEEQVAAIVIGINLDHISEEDMTKLSEKYGSLEDLNQSYLDGLYYMNNLAANYREMQFGRKYSEELCDVYEDEKIDFKHMVISEDYKDIAQISENSYYIYLRPFQVTDADYEKMDNLEKNCAEEKAFTDLMNADGLIDNYGIVNPYTNVLELNMTK